MEVNVMAREYSLVIIDIDFFLRYCIRFTEKECDRLMDNIKTFFVNYTTNIFLENMLSYI